MTERKFYTSADIERHYDRWARGLWFSADSMRFFGTRLALDTYGEDGSLFVTSERRWGDPARTYGVRWYRWAEIPFTDNTTPRGDIVSGPRFATRYLAHRFAASLSVGDLRASADAGELMADLAKAWRGVV